jgi:hypothetical protein
MPSSSKKQHNFMAAIANNPAFAKKVGIPQSVGKDFTTADKGRKFSKGGDMATKMNPGFMAMMAKKKGMQEGSKADMASDKKQMMGMKKGGMKKMAEGGMTGMMQGAVNKHESRLHKGATMTKLANGGSFRASANGIAQQGKTKGTQIKMNKGGMSC